MVDQVAVPKLPKTTHRYLYRDHRDHVAFRNAGYDGDVDPFTDIHPDERAFDHRLTDAEIEQHFPKPVEVAPVEAKQE